MNGLWRGDLATRLRIASGLVLFAYALFHFLNIGLGLFSSELMQQAQEWRHVVTRSLIGGIVLYAAFLTHIGLALYKLANRTTLKMPLWEAVQSVLGLLIPVWLIIHIVFTRVANEVYGVDDQMAYLIALIFGHTDGWLQSMLLLIVWFHSCTGLHFWLRGQDWWQKSQAYLIGFATLVPAFALAGFLTEGRRVQARMADPDLRADLFQVTNWPDQNAVQGLLRIEAITTALFWLSLALVAIVFIVRQITFGGRSVRVRYVYGPEITSPKGPTLLEMSRANGVTHTSLCGGRGRCTTCRVMVEEGGEFLHPPSEAETRSLEAVSAPPGTRLACQIRPTQKLTVFRVFRADGTMTRAHASEGQERRMAVLFLDIRGFTERTTGQLPYDVVFLLNRFFDAIVPAITAADGVVDKYLGDGLLALFEHEDEQKSAASALQAAKAIGEALEQFNLSLEAEGEAHVRIGIGLHLGDLVLGEIGTAGNSPRTIIGETVNAASRLEAMTKELAVELLVSEPVLQSAAIDTDALDLKVLQLRGVREPLPSLSVERASTLFETIGYRA